MALELTVDFIEQNDNKALQITDEAGTYNNPDNLTGWGSPNPVVTDIVISTNSTPGKYHLTLDITYTDSGGVSTIYDQINLYDFNGGAFSDVNDLVFGIDAADLLASGVAIGTDDDELSDGKYDFVYQLVDADNSSSVEATHSESILLDGIVRVKVYDQLRVISTIYDSTEVFVPIYHHQFKDILLVLLKKSMFDAMISSVYTSLSDEVLGILDVIERLTIND